MLQLFELKICLTFMSLQQILQIIINDLFICTFIFLNNCSNRHQEAGPQVPMLKAYTSKDVVGILGVVDIVGVVGIPGVAGLADPHGA